MERAALYMRVSTDKQAKEGDSIPAQKEALERYAREKGYIIVDTYIDDGISGTKADRDELQRLLEDVKQGRIDIVLVTKLDRWFRSIRHYLNTQELLEKHHVSWTAIWEPIYDTSTAQGRLIISQMMSIAQFEAENTSQRIKAVFDYKRKQGEYLSGKPPVGYKVENKHLVPDPETADHVRAAFTFFAQTSSLSRTMDEFAHLGIFPKDRQPFQRMLRNEKYIGKYLDNETYCRPIIDKSLFEDVQRKLPNNIKASQKRTYIFSGLIRCRECGRKMNGTTQYMARGTKKYKAYSCPGHYNARPAICRNPKHINEKKLEEYLLENIKPLLKMKVDAVRKEEKKDNSQRITYLEKKIKKLKELYINDLIDLKEYKEDKESALAEISTLQAHRTIDTKPYEDFIKLDIGSQYKTFTDAEKRIFWRALIEKIEFGQDKKYTVYFLEPVVSSNDT